MFNVSELYSMLQVLRANFHQVDCNELAFTSMKEKKKDPRLFNHVSDRILAKNRPMACFSCNTFRLIIVCEKLTQTQMKNCLFS